jgi:hypothetical protein
MYQQPAMPAINSPGDAFGWPFRDPGWVGKILVQGLINIIPVLGQMALFGWMLGSLDNLRQGRQELQGAGFGNLGRGAILWVVYFVYGVIIGVVAGAITLIGAAAGHGDTSSGVYAAFSLIANLLELIGYVILALCFPTIVLLTDREGIGGGLNFPRVLSTIQLNSGTALQAGLFAIIASIIGAVGVVVCCVGLIFTVPYGSAILAGVVFWLERNLPLGPGQVMGGPSQPPSMPPPPPPPQPSSM